MVSCMFMYFNAVPCNALFKCGSCVSAHVRTPKHHIAHACASNAPRATIRVCSPGSHALPQISDACGRDEALATAWFYAGGCNDLSSGGKCFCFKNRVSTFRNFRQRTRAHARSNVVRAFAQSMLPMKVTRCCMFHATQWSVHLHIWLRWYCCTCVRCMQLQTRSC